MLSRCQLLRDVSIQRLPPCSLHLHRHSPTALRRPRKTACVCQEEGTQVGTRRPSARTDGPHPEQKQRGSPAHGAGGDRPRGRALTALHPLGACEPSGTSPGDFAPCSYQAGGHSPSSRLGRSVSKWTWGCLSEATPYCPGRKAVTSLTLMPSNRDRARRGRRARNVRSDLMGPISAKPRVLATRLIRETCGR